MVKQFLRLIIFSSLTLACFCSCKDEPAVTESSLSIIGAVDSDLSNDVVTGFASQIGLGSFFGASGGDSGVSRALKQISNQLNILTKNVNKLIAGQAIIEGQISDLSNQIAAGFKATTDEIHLGNLATHCSTQIGSLSDAKNAIQTAFQYLQYFLDVSDTPVSTSYTYLNKKADLTTTYNNFRQYINVNNNNYSMNVFKNTLINDSGVLSNLDAGLLKSCAAVIIKSNGYPFLTGSTVHTSINNLVNFYANYQAAASILEIWSYLLPTTLPDTPISSSPNLYKIIKNHHQSQLLANLKSQYSLVPPPVPENHFVDVRTSLLWYPYVDKKSTENKVVYTYAEVAPLLNHEADSSKVIDNQTRIKKTYAFLGLPSPTILADQNYTQYYDLPSKSDWDTFTSSYTGGGSNPTTVQQWLQAKTNNVWPASFEYNMSSIWIQGWIELLVPNSPYVAQTIMYPTQTLFFASADLLINNFVFTTNNAYYGTCYANGPLASPPLAKFVPAIPGSVNHFYKSYSKCLDLTPNSACMNPSSCENRLNCEVDNTDYITAALSAWNYSQRLGYPDEKFSPIYTAIEPDGKFGDCRAWPSITYYKASQGPYWNYPGSSIVFKKASSYNYANLM